MDGKACPVLYETSILGVGLPPAYFFDPETSVRNCSVLACCSVPIIDHYTVESVATDFDEVPGSSTSDKVRLDEVDFIPPSL